MATLDPGCGRPDATRWDLRVAVAEGGGDGAPNRGRKHVTVDPAEAH